MRRNQLDKPRTPLLVALIGTVALMLAIAPMAAAQAPTDAQYDDDVELAVERAEAQGGAGGGAAEPEGESGVLAVTGADLFVLVAIAISLGAAAIGLRRLSAAR